jgi:6-pyruvoyltetrahydropterin/6-carboxytetrahydropterin synthase
MDDLYNELQELRESLECVIGFAEPVAARESLRRCVEKIILMMKELSEKQPQLSENNVYRVCKIFKFCAAHHLPGHEKCGVTHGHNYKVEFTLQTSKLDSDGMVIDFAKIKLIMEDVIERLDHSNLNEVLEFKLTASSPTAENIAMMLLLSAKRKMKAMDINHIEAMRMRVWETDSSYAEVVC